MERSEVKFRARDQVLTFTGGIRRYASDTVNYVEACFELSDNWSGYDAVTAVWNNGTTRISTVLDSHGACCVPQEVLSKKGEVYVNLAGTTSAGGAVTERLTTYPVWVLSVDAKSHTRGAEQAEITPTQFEQFASAVRSDASDAREAASASAASATASAQSASSSAQSASEAAGYSRSAMTAAEQAHTDASTAQGYRNDTEQHAQQASASASSASTSEQNAREYAQNADDSADAASMASTYASRMKDLAEQAKTSAESARDTILGMSATATTLEAGSEATASYSDGLLTIGVPRGAKGDRGETGPQGPTGATGAKGDRGDTGATPNLTIGTVETLEPTESASATITGTAENPVLNLGIPQGRTGEVSLEDLEALLPTDTASGDIVTITDGQAIIPAKSLKVTLEPIQEGSGTPSPDNIRPISGHTEVVTHRTGINVWDEEWEVGGYNSSTGEKYTATNTIRTKNYVSVVPSTTYRITADFGACCCYDANKSYIGQCPWRYGDVAGQYLLDVPSNARFIRIGFTRYYGTTYNHDISINYPSTDTEYHAYQGTTYTTSLGQTVYGGTLDVVSGELVVDRAMVDLGSLNWSDIGSYYASNSALPNVKAPDSGGTVANAICEKYEVATSNGISGGTQQGLGIRPNGMIYATDFGEPPSGNICYELATPQTIQLTPQEVQLLLGTNNVWSDGSVTLVYSADIQRYIEKKLQS